MTSTPLDWTTDTFAGCRAEPAESLAAASGDSGAARRDDGQTASTEPSRWMFQNRCRIAIMHALLVLLNPSIVIPAAMSQALDRPQAPASAAPPDDGQWLTPAKNDASTRYSELNEINTGNVKDLKVAFTFSTGINRGHEGAPLVVGSTMFIVTPYPNILYAL